MQLKINFPGLDVLMKLSRLFSNSARLVPFYFATIGNRVGHSCRLASELLMKLIYDPRINIIHRFTFFYFSASRRQPAKFRLHLFHNLFSSQISFCQTRKTKFRHILCRSRSETSRHADNVENVFENTTRRIQSTNSSLSFPRQGKQ